MRRDARLELVGQSSLKATLDIDWDDALEQQGALQRLLDEVERLRGWLRSRLGDRCDAPPLSEALALLAQVIEQDIEPDPESGGPRIRRGVTKDRRISVTDKDMRHGRKSRSKVINGFKRHVALDLDTGLILGGTVRPANEPEHRAAEWLRPDAERFGSVSELHIDRGYLASPWTRDLHDSGVRILSKPWHQRGTKCFAKRDFSIDLARQAVTCPAGETVPIRKGKVARFRGQSCDGCKLREQCTKAKSGRGRSVSIHPQEDLLISFREELRTPEGRKALRKRTSVEHSLAHICNRQGPRARYRGIRMNTFDVRRTAAVQNLHTADRMRTAA